MALNFGGLRSIFEERNIEDVKPFFYHNRFELVLAPGKGYDLTSSNLYTTLGTVAEESSKSFRTDNYSILVRIFNMSGATVTFTVTVTNHTTASVIDQYEVTISNGSSNVTGIATNTTRLTPGQFVKVNITGGILGSSSTTTSLTQFSVDLFSIGELNR